jgi:hypothetical protein
VKEREEPVVVDVEEPEAAEAVVVMAKPEAEEAVVETVKAEEAAVVEIVPLVSVVSPAKVKRDVRENLSSNTPKRRRLPIKPRWPSVMPKLLPEVKNPDAAVEVDLRVRDVSVVNPVKVEMESLSFTTLKRRRPPIKPRWLSVMPKLSLEVKSPDVAVVDAEVEAAEAEEPPVMENARKEKPVRRLPPSKARPPLLLKSPLLSTVKKKLNLTTKIPRPCPESPTKST